MKKNVTIESNGNLSFSKKVRLYIRIAIRILLRREIENGSNRTVTLRTIYNRYLMLHLPTVTESTRIKYIGRAEKFLRPFLNDLVSDLTPERVAAMILHAKATHVRHPCSKRFNFIKELRDLRAMLQWWSDQVDFKFRNPVRTFHAALSVMEEIPERDRKISMEETTKFFKALSGKSFYQDIAITQFYCGGRIGEIAGIHVRNIDLERRILKIKEVVTWINGVPKIKHCPKNGKTREVFINATLLEIFTRRMKDLPSGCLYLFHSNLEPVRYNRINVAFNRGWKRAGLSGKFSGSHLMRFSSAQAARKLTGSLDAAASVTGHTSMAMAAHYGKLDTTALNQSSVTEIEKYMRALNPETSLLQNHVG